LPEVFVSITLSFGLIENNGAAVIVGDGVESEEGQRP
jgi:hypothetical protein